MHLSRSIAALAGLTLTCSPALAQQAASPAAPAIIVPGQPPEKKIVCRYEAGAGTHIASRICHTEQEWEDLRERHIRAWQQYMDRPKVTTCGGAIPDC